MLHPLISIVIPAFNAESYIKEAIDSVVCQTYGNWQVLVGDDCSSDGTLEICRAMAAKDQRIKVFLMPEHKGEANSVRQELLKYAEGEWIHELDADDMLAPDTLEKMARLAEETGADVVTQRSVSVLDDGTLTSDAVPADGFDFGRIYTGEEACRLTIPSWRINMNGGLYRPELLRRAETERREFMRKEGMEGRRLVFDDELLSRFILKNAGRVAVSPAIYYRRESPTSITRLYSVRRFDIIHAREMVLRFAERFMKDLVPAAEFDRWWTMVCQVCEFEYNKRKLNGSERRFANSEISRFWHDTDYRNSAVRSRLPLWRRWVMTYNYALFRTFIYLRCKIR